MTAIHVTASREYDILIEPGILDELGQRTAAIHHPCKAAVVSDSNVYPLYGARAEASLSAAGFETVSFVFPAGEESKNLGTYSKLLGFLAENKLSRSDIIIALGGGVTGDMAGFAAATYLRGIEFVQVPTTLLAMVDSSVGGKTAVDLDAGKNLVGAFHQPSLVLCDTDTLATLPDDIFRDGCAEVIKYGLLGDENFFNTLAATHVRDNLEPVIARCVSMKRDLVAEDEFDTGARRLLNLGHTFGHAVEAKSDFSISHGSAVAMGMALITRAAAKLGHCDDSVPAAVEAILNKYGLPTAVPYSAEELHGISLNDKKIANAKMHLIVPDRIGHCNIVSIALEDAMIWLRTGGAQ